MMIFRLLVPLSKLQTGRQAVDVASKGIELFGGAGFMEDTGLPSHLRDAQVVSCYRHTLLSAVEGVGNMGGH